MSLLEMFKIQTLFKSKNILLEINSLEPQLFPETLSSADQVMLTLNAALLGTIQFHFIKDKNIDLQEQIKWQINALLDQSIENYFFDYQLFNNNNEQEIRGLCCSIEKQKLDPLIEMIQTINKNICSISSIDNQFFLYKKSIPFWEQTSLIKTLTKAAIIATLFITTLGVPLALNQNSSNKRLQQSIATEQNKLSALSKKYNQLFTLQKQQAQREIAHYKHTQLLQNLKEITAKTPPKFFFQEVSYLQEKNSLEILGYTEAGLNAIDKYTKTIKQIKDIKSATITKTTNNNNTTSFEITTLLNNSKNKTKNKIS